MYVEKEERDKRMGERERDVRPYPGNTRMLLKVKYLEIFEVKLTYPQSLFLLLLTINEKN